MKDIIMCGMRLMYMRHRSTIDYTIWAAIEGQKGDKNTKTDVQIYDTTWTIGPNTTMYQGKWVNWGSVHILVIVAKMKTRSLLLCLIHNKHMACREKYPCSGNFHH